MRTAALLLSAVGLIVGLTGCMAQPSEQFILNEALLRESFDQGYAWRGRIAEGYGVDFRIEDGAYRAYSEQAGFVSGLNVERHTDVVIDVETTQLSMIATTPTVCCAVPAPIMTAMATIS